VSGVWYVVSALPFPSSPFALHTTSPSHLLVSSSLCERHYPKLSISLPHHQFTKPTHLPFHHLHLHVHLQTAVDRSLNHTFNLTPTKPDAKPYQVSAIPNDHEIGEPQLLIFQLSSQIKKSPRAFSGISAMIYLPGPGRSARVY
jgi:hypothetical protein